MRVAPPIVLTEEQERTLRRWACGRSLPARQVERASRGRQAGFEDRCRHRDQQSEGITLEKAIPSTRLGGFREGCASPGRTPTITPAAVQEVVRKTRQEKPANATPLEHARHGGGNGSQREERASHLA